MVEGGREVISAFQAEGSKRGIVDSVVITVAPMWVGAAGVSAMMEEQVSPTNLFLLSLLTFP